MVRIAYSVLEVAEMLGKSKSTIWKYLSEGRLTRHKLGGSTLIPAEEVDALGRRKLQETTLGNNKTMSQNNDLTSSL
jgi:excisionase family DNA binding protein